MEYSILIVTRERVEELRVTLSRLFRFVRPGYCDVSVFIDGCKATAGIAAEFPWVTWRFSENQMGASAARNRLYKMADGAILIGLDDDAHPLMPDFLERVKVLFDTFPNTGILAFREIKGVFENDAAALATEASEKDEFMTRDFIGSGFAIRKDVYDATRGFPIWIDIYGEEPVLAMEVLDLGFDIRYVPSVAVHHRIDRSVRRAAGRHYFRFERQLRNSFFTYVVYYRFPLREILRLLWHNFNKYGRTDFRYFRSYLRALGTMIWRFPAIMRFRKPLKKDTFEKMKLLKNLPY